MCHLLGLANDDYAGLIEVCRKATSNEETSIAPGGWTWAEVRAIVWRYRHNERLDQILARSLCTHTKSELQHLFDRCVELFPFLEVMNRLRRDLAAWPKAEQALSTPGLWQRLVFQCYCRDTTQHRDIHERTAPAAALAGYNLTPGMLNVWLSNGRLFTKLASYIQSRESSK